MSLTETVLVEGQSVQKKGKMPDDGEGEDDGGLYELCGFNSSADNLLTRFVYNPRERSLTPCAELGLLTLDHFMLLFFIVLALWAVVSIIAGFYVVK